MQYNEVCSFCSGFLLISTGEYGLEITNNGPITTGAQATVHASLSMKNDSVTSNLYHFNWIYAPLILIQKSEQQFNSVIKVTGEFPGTFPVSVWVTHRDCWLCQPVARNVTVLQITGKMALQLLHLWEFSIHQDACCLCIRKIKTGINMPFATRV